jgi:hypothetical protein
LPGRDKWFSIRRTQDPIPVVVESFVKVPVMAEPYYHVRFRLDEPLDLDRTRTILSGSFGVKVLGTPHEGDGLTFSSAEKGEVKVAADTLSAILEPYRAVLFLREAKPFTRLDIALRGEVVRLYDRMSPYRSEPIPEPDFDVEM